MDYRTLGRTDIKVSAIGLGTMTWGKQNTEEDAHGQMDYAVVNGITLFDTAELYAVPPEAETQGLTETYIGTWFKKTGKRSDIVLASKIAGPGLPWIRGGKPFDGNAVRLACEDSLKRLQTDYIDLYQLHWPVRPGYQFGSHWTFNPDPSDTRKQVDHMRDVLTALGDLVKEGKIRHAGLSNETAWGTMSWLRLAEEGGAPRMASIQNEYSLLMRLFEPDLAEVALREQVGLLAYSPLATGILSGKYAGGKIPPGSRYALAQRNAHRLSAAAFAATEAYHALARESGLDPVQMALAFVTSRPFVTSNLIGATSMEQLKVNIGSKNVTLAPDVLAGIDRIRRDYPLPY